MKQQYGRLAASIGVLHSDDDAGTRAWQTLVVSKVLS